VRRLAAIFLALAASGALAFVIASGSAQGSSSSALIANASAKASSTSTFAVIFDDARGLIAGQLVKVAGAQAGTIKNVTVVKQGRGANTSFKAKIEGSIDSKFMPFHANATCTIRPQGLIAENYLECDPGSPPAPVIKSRGGQPPTVPVQNTTEPVSLLDLFNIFNAPTRQRFALILNELGIGTAGEGENFNDILYRANPALKLANQVIGILARQSAQLKTLIDATNTIAQEGANHTAALQSFLDQAAALTSTTAAHRSNLELAINRLPRLLAVAQPSLSQLDVVAREGTPLVKQLGVAAPYLNKVSIDLGPFVTQAKPGLARLSSALDIAIPAIKHATPLVAALNSYTTRSLPKTQLSGKLFTSLQHAGFLENFLGIIYYVGAGISRFDQTSHLLDFAIENIQNGACTQYATTPVPGCGANYGSASASATASAARAGTGSAVSPSARSSATHATGRIAGASRGAQQSSSLPQQPPSAQQQPAQSQPSQPSAPVPQQPTATTTTTATSQSPGGNQGSGVNSLLNLLNYLLK
jgi:ABC-type transporter Mla subunit MlaD